MTVFLSTFICLNTSAQVNKKLLVVAGGHRFDTLTFFSLFKQIDGFTVDELMQPQANKIIANGDAAKYDVILFYDSWKIISEDEKQGYYNLLEKGVGLVFMHHALVSYQDWPEFIDIIGGKYKKPRFSGDTTNLSDFKHDIQMLVKSNLDHEITQNIGEFEIFDEGYMNFDVIESVTPIMTTEHEYCDSVIGWAHQVKNSRVVYLLPGHDKNGLTNSTYREIIENSIKWVSIGCSK